jgi:outer membrane protein OmpA-like peptidoglycan-associated protein
MARTKVLSFLRSVAAGTVLISAGLLLSGCVNNTPLDDLEYAKVTGSPFDTALYKNYAFLARSFGDVGSASHSVFDIAASWSLNDTDSEVAGLANAFAQKAVAASKGEFVDPEPARDPASHEMRDRLLRALEPGRDSYPRDAARAQADYDCWLLNATVELQKPASAQCRKSLEVTLTLLESETEVAQPAAPEQTAAADKAAPPPAEVPGIYTVYFDFDSWALAADELKTLDKVAADVKDGKAVKVKIVGHADTSGPEPYNMRLSVRRAKVTKEALAAMGVKRKIIATIGVGETDLAVETGDNVREPKNRRAVITETP